MAAPEWISAFIEPLNRLQIDYMITGAVGAMAYGEPRATMDVDIVIRLTGGQVPSFIASFPEAAFYCPPQEVIHQEIARPARGQFNIIHRESGMKADFYPVGRDDLHLRALERRRVVEGLSLAPPEYVIVRKLEYHREGQSSKHLRDVSSILLAGCPLDRPWLETELARRGLMPVWDEVRREARGDSASGARGTTDR
jgi:hypothetical protein